MKIYRLYCEASLVVGADISLPEEAAHHLLNVLRARTGDHVIVFNERDGGFEGTLSIPKKRQAILHLHDVESTHRESPLHIHVAMALLHTDALTWSLQKVTELGATRISLLKSQYTQYRLQEDKLDKKMAHFQSVLQHAVQQCGRTKPPQLHAPQTLATFLVQEKQTHTYFLSPDVREKEIQKPSTASHVTLLIGPEGGFSSEEETLCRSQGCLPHHLGPRILRADTAAAAAVCWAQSTWGDM